MSLQKEATAHTRCDPGKSCLICRAMAVTYRQSPLEYNCTKRIFFPGIKLSCEHHFYKLLKIDRGFPTQRHDSRWVRNQLFVLCLEARLYGYIFFPVLLNILKTGFEVILD